MLSNEMFIETKYLDIFLKNELDHHDFTIGQNPDYLRARTIADAKIMGKREELIDSKKKLADYEKNFDEKMPKTMKLKLLRKHAQDAVDQNVFYDRNLYPRSKHEDEHLARKIKKLEKVSGTDLSPLLNKEQDDLEKINRHKKAFDTYKSYSFLKAGLKKTPLEKELTGEADVDASQYKFPSPDDVAKVFVNDKFSTTLLEEGEENTNPGRKFGYSRRQFIESYFGKSLERKRYLNLNDREIYSFNDELKVTYSRDHFSGLRKLDQMQKERVENQQERERITQESTNPEYDDEQKRIFKELESGEQKFDIGTLRSPNRMLDGRYEDRVKKYLETGKTSTAPMRFAFIEVETPEAHLLLSTAELKQV